METAGIAHGKFIKAHRPAFFVGHTLSLRRIKENGNS